MAGPPRARGATPTKPTLATLGGCFPFDLTSIPHTESYEYFLSQGQIYHQSLLLKKQNRQKYNWKAIGEFTLQGKVGIYMKPNSSGIDI